MNIIQLITGFSTGTAFFFAVMFLGMGMTVGVEVGYDAESHENASVEWNGTHMSIGGNSSQMLPGENETFDDLQEYNQSENNSQPYDLETNPKTQATVDLPDGFEDLYQSSAKSFINTMMKLIAIPADSWATFTFQIRDTVPKTYADAYVTGWLIVGMGYSLLITRREAFE